MNWRVTIAVIILGIVVIKWWESKQAEEIGVGADGKYELKIPTLKSPPPLGVDPANLPPSVQRALEGKQPPAAWPPPVVDPSGYGPR